MASRSDVALQYGLGLVTQTTFLTFKALARGVRKNDIGCIQTHEEGIIERPALKVRKSEKPT